MENNIGALWVKENQKGDFYKGYINLDNGEKLNIVIFKNNYKKNDRQPDFQILKAKEFGKQEQEVQNDDDLPF